MRLKPRHPHRAPRQRAPQLAASIVLGHVYRGLIRVIGTWNDVGVEKGRVLDRYGNGIYGARVKISIGGSTWNDPANPTTTNAQGWYEFVLGVGQRVSFREITVPGRQAKLSSSAVSFVVTTQAAAYHHVDFQEQ